MRRHCAARRAGAAGTAFLLAAFALPPRACAEQPPTPSPVTIRIFYSSQDPNWAKAAAIVEQVRGKAGEKVKIETLDIEEVENYKALSKSEKDIPIEPTGDITAVVGNFALTSRGDKKRDVENYLEYTVEALLKPKKGPVRGNLQAFAREVFGSSVQVVTPDGPGVALAAFKPLQAGGQEPVGWVQEINAVVDCPVCADASFLVALDAYGKTASVRPLRELEKYGKPIDPAPFLGQFLGRRVEGDLAVGAGVQGITGATKTARVYVNGLKLASTHFYLYKTTHSDRYKSLPPEPALPQKTPIPDAPKAPAPDAPKAPPEKGGR